MRLQTIDGKLFELRILGYQFPDMETQEYDSNWLMVEGRLKHPRGDWEFREPCLLTYEVSGLADWLDSLARGTSSLLEASFIEPNLSFRWVQVSSRACLRVYFDSEARPPWASSGSVVDESCWIDFPAADIELERAAAALRDQLDKYPQRAEH